MFFNLFKKSDKPDAKVDAKPDGSFDNNSDNNPLVESPAVEVVSESEPAPVVEPPVVVTPPEAPAKLGFFARIKQGLSRTSSHFAEGLGNLFLGRIGRVIDQFVILRE